jgi:hypothetical protein
MSLFCLLCVPLIFFLRRSDPIEGKHSIWALPLGGIVATIQYFFGPFLAPGAFGLSRWISGFVDIISLPVLIPPIICAVLIMLKKFSATMDYAGFTLVWIIPLAAIHALTNLPSLLPLVIVPLLWIAQALGISFFIRCMIKKPHPVVIIFSVLGILALPGIATTSWWAFFINDLPMGALLLGAGLIPALISLIIEGKKEEVVSDQLVVDSEDNSD